MISLRSTLAVVLLAATQSVQAASLGTNITINDGNVHLTNLNGWYGLHEDNETEAYPTTLKGQHWDLEGMYLDNSLLTMVGGYNFVAGTTYDNYTYRPGDIFIDVTGNAQYTRAENGSTALTTSPVNNSFGYDYVVHFNYNLTDPLSTTYSVYSIDSSSQVLLPTDVPGSSPWRYSSGGQEILSNQSIAGFGLLDSLTVSQLTTFGSGTGTQPAQGLQGYQGNNDHYFMGVDLSFLPGDQVMTIHYTFECGNDNLMGSATSASVPDYSSSGALLLGSLSLLGLVRRQRRK